MKPQLLSGFFVVTLFFLCCKKKDTVSPEILTSAKWKWSLYDQNLSTNPSSGIVLYYPVQDCEKDDVFEFSSNGTLTIDRGSVKCKEGEIKMEKQQYSIDRSAKKIIINTVTYTLLEETEKQIKYYSPLPAATGHDYLIFLLEKF